MRLLLVLVCLGSCFAVFQSRADAAMPMDKTKTAILPSGGFYSLYEARCPYGSATDIASMRRGQRWCSAPAGELVCFRQPAEALDHACLKNQMAASDPDQDSPES